MVWSHHQPRQPLAPMSASAARQRHPAPEHTPILSLSLSLTHSHTRAHRQRCRPHTHAAGIPARLCRAHDISMFYRCRKLLSARPGAGSGLHRLPWTPGLGVRGPPRVPTPVGFWPPPKREHDIQEPARNRIWHCPPQAVFILFSPAPIGTSTPAFFF